MALELKRSEFTSIEEMKNHLDSKFQYLLTARPTAVNIAESAKNILQQVSTFDPTSDVRLAKESLLASMEAMLREDFEANRTMGEHGAEEIAKHMPNGRRKAVVLTHCNTGSLATAGYGTALGVVRSLHSRGSLEHFHRQHWQRASCLGGTGQLQWNSRSL